MPLGKVREFEGGATRDTDEGKLDYEGFLSPLVLERYAQYMNKNRVQSDGNVRDSDNWQKGIPLPQYIKSLWRHFFAVWKEHRSTPGGVRLPVPGEIGIDEDLCGVLFNTMGYLHEFLKLQQRARLTPRASGSGHSDQGRKML